MWKKMRGKQDVTIKKLLCATCCVDFFSCGHLVEDESLADEAPFASRTQALDKH